MPEKVKRNFTDSVVKVKVESIVHYGLLFERDEVGSFYRH